MTEVDLSREPADPPFPPDLSADSIFQCVLLEFESRWEDGRRPQAETFLPMLDEGESYQAAELVHLEFRLAREAGLEPDPSDYHRRFPHLRDALARFFSLDQDVVPSDLRDWAQAAEFPHEGYEVGPFLLLKLLGKGGLASVFLADRFDLPEALCVIKISSKITAEPALLARLRHPNIVEVMRQATTEDGSLQLVCMPFHGGTTLSALLASFGRSVPRSGVELLERLDAVSPKEYDHAAGRRPDRDQIAKLSGPKALGWIVARIAEALNHAEGRGVNHGDVKPSNILVGGDGVPRLFDFNLSVDRENELLGRASVDQAGGTLVYMAPERLNAIRGRRTDRDVSRRLVPRSDLYSLGLVLLEAIGRVGIADGVSQSFGTLGMVAQLYEERGKGPSAFSKGLKRLPAGLRPIVEKLLEANPADRYANGLELAEDLDAWIADRPLPHADMPVGFTRAANFLRRNRWKTLAASAVVLLALGAAEIRRRTAERAGADLLRLELTTPHKLKGDLSYGFALPGDEDSDDFAVTLDFGGVDIASKTAPYVHDWTGFRSLTPGDQEDLEVLVLERVYRKAARLALRSSKDDRAEALALVDWVLAHRKLEAFQALRTRLKGDAGLDPRVPRFPFETNGESTPDWLEWYMKGVARLTNAPREAYKFFAPVEQAGHAPLLATHHLAEIDFRLGVFDAAAPLLAKCVERHPRDAVLLTQAAAVEMRRGNYSAAERLCLEAGKVDLENEDALWMQLSITNIGRKDGKEIAKRIGELKRQPMAEPNVRMRLDFLCQIGVARLLNHDLKLAEADLRSLVEEFPEDTALRLQLARQLASKLDARDKEKAVEHFKHVLRGNPDHLWARYGLAWTLLELKRKSEALPQLERLIEHPRFEELLRDFPGAHRIFSVVVVMYLERGDSPRAYLTAQRALQLFVDREMSTATPLYYRALALMAMGGDEPEIAATAAWDLLRAELENSRPEPLSRSYCTDASFAPHRRKLDPLLGW